MPTTTYKEDYQRPVAQYKAPISSHGTLAKEGIRPVTSANRQGIGGTRFKSDSDIKSAALQTAFGLPSNKPFTPKEARLVQGAGYKMGVLVQHGGFIGEKRCLVEKADAFTQCKFKLATVINAISSIKSNHYASFWGGGHTIQGIGNKEFRIDRQGATQTHQNIQVQANKSRVAGQSTTASAILLDRDLGVFSAPAQEPQRKQVVAKVKQALSLSAKTGHWYEVKLG